MVWLLTPPGGDCVVCGLVLLFQFPFTSCEQRSPQCIPRCVVFYFSFGDFIFVILLRGMQQAFALAIKLCLPSNIAKLDIENISSYGMTSFTLSYNLGCHRAVTSRWIPCYICIGSINMMAQVILPHAQKSRQYQQALLKWSEINSS